MCCPAATATRNQRRTASDRFFVAVLTILIADATMSLDNILAVEALAHGNIGLIVAGLLFSMAVLFTASALIARLMEVVPWLIDLAALIIAYTAADLVVADPVAQRYLHFNSPAAIVIHAGAVAFVLAVDVVLWRRARRRNSGSQHTSAVKAKQMDAASAGLNGHVPRSNDLPNGNGRISAQPLDPRGERRTEQSPSRARGSEPPRR